MSNSSDCPEQFRLIGPNITPKFSIDQIAYYCPLFAEYSKFDYNLNFALGLSSALTGAIGLITNALTYLTFARGFSFNGPSFLYHKSMAILELLHMAIMCQCGVLQLLDFPSTGYWMQWWRMSAWAGWLIGDAGKVGADFLVAFVSLERMIAVSSPVKFDMINTYPIAIGAIIFSSAIGSVHILGFAATKLKSVAGDYVIEVTKFGDFYYNVILQSINVIKLALGVITFVCCVFVAGGVYRSKKKAAKMSEEAKQKWNAAKMACYLQLVVGITTVVTQATYVWFRVVEYQLPFVYVGRMAMVLCQSFEEALQNLHLAKYRLSVQLVHAVCSELDHGGRFFFYVVFHSTFRASFAKALKRCWSDEEQVTARVISLKKTDDTAQP